MSWGPREQQRDPGGGRMRAAGAQQSTWSFQGPDRTGNLEMKGRPEGRREGERRSARVSEPGVRRIVDMDAEPTTPRAGVAREGDTGPDVNPWGPTLVREFHSRAAATAQGHLRLILYLFINYCFLL